MVEFNFPIEKAVRESKTNQVGDYDHRMSVDQRVTLLNATFKDFGPPFPRNLHDQNRKKNIRHRLTERGLIKWSVGERTPEVTPQGKKVALEILKEIDEEKYEIANNEILAEII